MADLQDGIDRISRAFAQAVAEGKFKIADRLAGMIERGATAEEVSRALASLTVDDLIQSSGLAADLTAMQGEYAGTVLARMVQFAPVSPEVLTALVQADQARYLQFVRGEVADLVRGLQQTILTGGDARTLRAVALKGVTRAQAEALVNTTVNTFSRSVTAVQAAAAPEETLYVYAGPIDGKTRDLCLKMAAAGELTAQEIERQFPGGFRDGGGFNCRHQWLPVGTTARRYAGQAQEAIAGRGDKWRDPLTVQQQLEARDGTD